MTVTAAPARRVLIPPTLDDPGLRPGVRPVHALSGRTMGTTWSVKLVPPPGMHVPDLRDGIQARLDRVVAEMSHWDPASDLGRFNRASAGRWQELPEDFAAVLDCALAVARDSGGAYDPTVGPLVDLWGFGPDGPRDRTPDPAAVEEALARCGWQRLELDRDSRRVYQPGGLRLDLSSIAKGFGVDVVALHLEALGIDSHLVEVGGELRGRGVKPDGMPWWVALETPPDAAVGGAGAAVVALHGLSVATSGDYRRFFEAGGVRYAHTLDPRAGRPVANRLASVTVLHPSCMWADAFATALTVLGPEEGMAFAGDRDLAALFLIRTETGLEERLTPALMAMLE
ncbi:FAD:protein FMN transferase [Azospirillum oleiclasticum]